MKLFMPFILIFFLAFSALGSEVSLDPIHTFEELFQKAQGHLDKNGFSLVLAPEKYEGKDKISHEINSPNRRYIGAIKSKADGKDVFVISFRFDDSQVTYLSFNSYDSLNAKSRHLHFFETDGLVKSFNRLLEIRGVINKIESAKVQLFEKSEVKGYKYDLKSEYKHFFQSLSFDIETSIELKQEYMSSLTDKELIEVTKKKVANLEKLLDLVTQLTSHFNCELHLTPKTRVKSYNILDYLY